MLREKDRNLSQACSVLADCSFEAMRWLTENGDAVGIRQQALVKTFRKYAVEARKLAQAAERPMSATIFGASQAGKSYMVGSFISPAKSPTKVVFEAGGERTELDFLTSVNPQGGKETTGIVTRFSIQPLSGNPRGFPVTLRALREIDVVKILANSHTFELNHEWEGQEKFIPQTAERLTGMVRSLPRSPTPVPGLSVEQIYELRDYMTVHLPRHPLGDATVSDPFWDALEEAGPFLAASERARALSAFWGELPEFTDLYATLKAALDRLAHPNWLYVPLAAIEDTSCGVLHAETLYALDEPYADSLQGSARAKTASTPVVADTGASCDLPRPVVTALAAELRLTLAGRPWDFLEHTDLLDFPGAKSREDSTVAKFLRAADHSHARAHCYLRGKVAVLFDTYVDDFEVNALVFAIDNSQSEVKKLGELVEAWVLRSHGPTPEERAKVSPVSFFFTMTKCDTLFGLDSSSKDKETVTNRFKSNLSGFRGWTDNWTPGRSFDNIFLFRNPRKEQGSIVTYEFPWPAGNEDDKTLPLETGYSEGFDKRRDDFRSAFIEVDEVRRYMANPADKFDALLTLNDGGLTYLCDALKPVCDMDLKVRQIQPVMERLRDSMLALLSEFHESSDVARRVAERVAKVHETIDALSHQPELFGPFIRQFGMSPVDIAQHYLDYVTRRGSAAKPGAVGSDRGGALRRGLDRRPAVVTPETSQAGFGRHLLGVWRERLTALSNDDALARGFSITPEQFATVMNEIVGYTALSRLEERIDAAIAKIERMPRRPDEIAVRAGMAAGKLLNMLVGELGLPPRVHTADAPKYPDLPEDPADLEDARVGGIVAWVRQLELATQANAREGQGGRISPEQNKRLGDLIAAIGGAA